VETSSAGPDLGPIAQHRRIWRQPLFIVAVLMLTAGVALVVAGPVRSDADGTASAEAGAGTNGGAVPDPHGAERATSTGEMADAADAGALLPADENAELRRRWEDLQTGFVDEPRQTVEHADELVAEVMQRLAEGFAAEREQLEEQWGRGEDISTEDLRVALQRYRAFFRRLLSA